MDFSLNDEQQLLRDSARDFLTAEWPVAELRRMLDPDDRAVAAASFWSKISELGWPGLLVSEEHEGLGLGLYDLAVLMEEAGRHLIPGGLHASGVLAVTALESLGSGEAKERYLPDIAEGATRATVGIYEQDSGWTPMLLRPPSGGGVTKRFVPDADGADVILFLGRTSGNSVQLSVAREPALSDLQSMDVTRPLFEVSCRTENLEPVGEGTLADLQAVVDRATIALSAEMVGSAARVLGMTVEYAKSRKQFGRAIGSFQAVQHKAADMLIGVEKGLTAVYFAAAAADESPERLAEAASVAKATANGVAVHAAQTAIQLHGGLGFTWEQDLHLHLKRAKACEFTYGDSRWHLDRIAHLLALT